MTLYSWEPSRRASQAHIREAIRYALWEKTEIATKSDAWYNSACQVSQQWRDKTRAASVKKLARDHLEYWRMRAFLMHLNIGHIDRQAFNRWQQFTSPAASD